jgi:hypothetical protein
MEAEQYEFIIGILSDKIKAQEKEITLQKWQIESLQKQLEQAEALLPTKTTLEIR